MAALPTDRLQGCRAGCAGRAGRAVMAWVWLCVGVLAGSGCGPLIITFDVPYAGRATVERGSIVEQLVDDLGFGELLTIDLSETREFANNDVRRSQVVSARLTAFNLVVESPQGANFDWLDRIAFAAGAPDLDSVRVAQATIDDGLRAVSLERDDVELAPYVGSSAFSLTTDATARRPPNDTVVRADLVFSISAELR